MRLSYLRSGHAHRTRDFSCASGVQRRGQDPKTQLAVSETSPGQSPGDNMGQKQLAFPWSKEEIYKEEVAE